MINSLSSRGFTAGSGVLDPTGSTFILNIPKNASSYVLSWANHHGWRPMQAQHVQRAKEVIVLLRDPMQRWLSGIAQYINTYILSVHGPNGPVFPGEPITHHDYVMDVNTFMQNYSDVSERLIFDNASRFDDHVWPQNEIIQGILPDVPRQYFRVDRCLDQKLCDHLGWQIIPDLDRNAAQNTVLHLKQFFQQRLELRPELLHRLQRHYLNDYALMSRVLT